MPKCPFCEQTIAVNAETCLHCRAPLRGLQPKASDDLEQRIRSLLDQDQKIAAIKLYREETGTSLADAKEAVESLQAGRGLRIPARDIPDGFEGDVLRLLSAGKKISAIKLYRERTGVGLKEAKEAVEAIGERHGLAVRGSGCLGVVLILGLAVILAADTLASSSANADEAPTISTAQKDDNGFLVHEVESGFQAGKTLIRVLLSDELDAVRRHPVVYVLPVETGMEHHYGDGLLELKKLDLHNKHGVIFVTPTFSQLPWYADHPTDKANRQESHFIKVVIPFVEEVYPAQANSEGRLLLGFSKSGWGAWSLLLRHPDVFGRAAAWDAPMMIERIGKYGNAPIFGDQSNFEAYRISSLLSEKGKSLGDDKRLILTGYGNFRSEHEDVHELLDEIKIPHEYRDGPQRKHDWHSGWVEEAVELLVGS